MLENVDCSLLKNSRQTGITDPNTSWQNDFGRDQEVLQSLPRSCLKIHSDQKLYLDCCSLSAVSLAKDFWQNKQTNKKNTPTTLENNSKFKCPQPATEYLSHAVPLSLDILIINSGSSLMIHQIQNYSRFQDSASYIFYGDIVKKLPEKFNLSPSDMHVLLWP